MTSNEFPATLSEALRHCSTGNKSITYISGKDKERTVTYRDLQTRAMRLLHQFQKAGLKKGSELILLTESNEHFIDAFWAALLGGIIPVPLTTSSNNTAQQRVLAVFRKLENPFLWTSEKTLSSLIDYAKNNDLEKLCPRLKQSTLLLDRIFPDETQGVAAPIEPEDTAFIQFSSGSTGTPKGVVLTHNNLMSNIRSILTGSESTQSDISLSWMPLTHDMGIIGFHLSPLVLNTDVYLMPPELFVRRPTLWLEKISEKKATISSSPNFGYQHLLKYFDPEKHSDIDLSSLRLIFNGAEPISAEICRRFYQVLKPLGFSENVIFPVYGLAEASLAATFSNPSDNIATLFVKRDQLHLAQDVQICPQASADTMEMVLLGGPVPDTEIRIADQDNREFKEDQTGFVYIRGQNVTGGYYDDDQLTIDTITEDRWLNTGDLGFIHKGQLVISGRYKDLIIINGQNYHPQDLEKLCESLPSIETEKVAACAVAGKTGEELAIFVMDRGELEKFSPLASEIRRLIAQESGIDAAQIIPVPSFPKTTSGKVQRFLLAEQYTAGQYTEIIEQLERLSPPAGTSDQAMTETERNLLDICNAIITNKTIGIDDNLFETGTSSLNLVHIHERIDNQYPEQVEVTDLFDYPTISELAAFLEQKSAN